VTVFDPTSRGIGALQRVVPDAVPDPPVLVTQVTVVTPTLSLAVPLNTIVADEVETEVDDGEAIVSEGAVVSVEPGVAVGGGVGVGVGVGSATGGVTVTGVDVMGATTGVVVTGAAVRAAYSVSMAAISSGESSVTIW
jgi:hypothetical protein